MELQCRGGSVRFPRRPLIMGIINVNGDSFSGDGRVDAEWALQRAAELVAEGADVIDVGGESARTNRSVISEAEEIRRLAPVVEGFRAAVAAVRPRDAAQVYPPLLSVNTWRPGVARAVLARGGHILNDMGALADAENAGICAREGAALLIMHSVGEPKENHRHVRHADMLAELERFFEAKLRLAREAGLPETATILDPGLDFAKTTRDGLRVLARADELAARFRRPLLLPVSRKGLIGETLGISDPAGRDAGTIACLVAGFRRGAAIFRVHNVNAAYLATKTLQAVAPAA